MSDSNNQNSSNVRLDKWLWAARFFKTRALAKNAVEGGKIHYNKARTKPSRTVEMGASIRMQLGWDEKTVIIKEIYDKRRGAPEAQLMYEETAESIAKREQHAQQRKSMNLTAQAPDHRPNKKERRDIMRFKTNQTE
jgi:ribosome-associated heat shock protein Hsp15